MSSLLDRLSSAPAHETALADSSGMMTKGELAAKAHVLAVLLKRQGCTRVALHADNSMAWILADLACQEADILCLPLPLFFTWPQTLHALHLCGINGLLATTPEPFAPHFPRRGEMPDSTGLQLLLQPHARSPRLPAGTGKVTFTSGSTGTPKGVCLSNTQLLRQAQVLCEATGLESPTHLCVLPLGTLLENVAGVYAPLMAGGKVVTRTMTEMGFSGSRLVEPHRLLRVIADLKPDTLIIIPQLLQLLVHAARQGWRAPSLKFIAVGGARVASELIVEARALGLPVFEGYGLSECASVVSLNTSAADRAGTCGKPLPHLELSIEDGEIHVGGNAMLGYVDEPASWYPKRIATGDLGRIDADGFLHIEGRRKNLLISSYGRNISPEWVESELLASDIIAEAVVYGDARPHCIALITPVKADVSDAAIESAIAAANTRLPDYAQVRQWLRLPWPLASVEGLLTPNGRPRRKQIAELHRTAIHTLYKRALEPAASHPLSTEVLA